MSNDDNSFFQGSTIEVFDDIARKFDNEIERALVHPPSINQKEFEWEQERFHSHLEELGMEQAKPIFKKVEKKFNKKLEQIFQEPIPEKEFGSFIQNCQWGDEWGYYITHYFLENFKDRFSEKLEFFNSSKREDNDLGFFRGVSEKDFIDAITKDKSFVRDNYDSSIGYEFVEQVFDYYRSPVVVEQIITDLEKSINKNDIDLAGIYLKGYFNGILNNSDEELSEEHQLRLDNAKNKVAKSLDKQIVKEFESIKKKMKANYDEIVNCINFKIEYSKKFEFPEFLDPETHFSNELKSLYENCDKELKIPTEIMRLYKFYDGLIQDKFNGKKQFFARKKKAIDLRFQREEEEKIRGLENLLSSITYSVPEFVEGEIGKIIMSYEPSENKISLLTLRYNRDDIKAHINPEDPKGLRNIFMSDRFVGELGFHDNIVRPSGSEVMGGGAYLVLSDNGVHIDYYSHGFGPMYKDLVVNCLQANGYKLSSLDDSFFHTHKDYLDDLKNMGNKNNSKDIVDDDDEIFF